MELTGTYQIRDLRIVNPTYKVVNVTDSIKEKTCTIEVVFTTESVLKYSYTVEGFSYENTWEDADVYDYVETAITKELLIV